MYVLEGKNFDEVSVEMGLAACNGGQIVYFDNDFGCLVEVSDPYQGYYQTMERDGYELFVLNGLLGQKGQPVKLSYKRFVC